MRKRSWAKLFWLARLAPALLLTTTLIAADSPGEPPQGPDTPTWAKQRVDEQPHAAVAYRTFIAVSRRNQDLAGARAYLSVLLAQQPNNAYLHYALALCDKEEKQYPSALARLQKAIALSPDFAEPFLEIARIYQATNDGRSGVHFFLDYIHTHPKSAYGYVGLAHSYELGTRSDKALRSQALDAAAAALRRDPKNLAAYRIQSRLYFQMGDDERFLRTNRKMAELARAARDEEMLAVSLGNLGLAYKNRHDTAAAIDYYRKALHGAEQIGYEELQCQYTHELGNLYIGFDDPQRAIAYLNRSLLWSQTLKDSAMEALSYLRIGEAYYRLEDWRALDYFTRALDRHKQQGDPHWIAYGYKNLGDYQLLVGNYPMAIQYYTEGLAQPSDTQTRAMLQGQLGLACLRRGDHERALMNYEKALAMTEETKNEAHKQVILGQLGSIAVRRHDTTRGLQRLQEALALARKTGQRESTGFWLARMGEGYLQRGELPEAEACYRRALALGKQLQDYPIVREAKKGFGLIGEARGDPTAAAAYYEEVIEDIENERNRFVLDREKAGFLQDKLDPYERMVRLLVRRYQRAGDPDLLRRAFLYSERARAQAFLQELPQGLLLKRLKTISPAYQVWDAQYQEKRNRIYGELLKVRAEGESLRKRAAAGKAIHNTELAGARLQTALDQLETEHLGFIKHQIPKTFPALAHLYPPEILAAERVQSWLGADEFLLAYHVQNEQTFVFLVGRSRLAVVELPFARSQKERFMATIQKLQSKVRPYSAAHRRAEEEALCAELEQLYPLIFAPLTAHLPRGSQLTIIWDDFFSYMPFGALVMGRQNGKPKYLIEDYALSYGYSASLLNPALWAGHGPPPRSMVSAVLLGNPRFGRDSASIWSGLRERIHPAPKAEAYRDDPNRLSQLPWAEEEVKSIGRLYDQPVVLTGAAATEAAFKSLAPAARVLHVATHVKADTEDPWHARILLAHRDRSSGDSDDGVIYLYEILDLDLSNTELVILSACESAVGKLLRGEGMDSPSRAFLYAGVPTVVASLWQVDDVATAKLMSRLHQYLAQELDARAALRRAQLDLIQDGDAHPHRWAAFVSVGKAGKIHVQKVRPPATHRWVLPMSLLLATAALLTLRPFLNHR